MVHNDAQSGGAGLEDTSLIPNHSRKTVMNCEIDHDGVPVTSCAKGGPFTIPSRCPSQEGASVMSVVWVWVDGWVGALGALGGWVEGRGGRG